MTKPLHVLILEDSEDDVTLLLRRLKTAGYATSHAVVEDLESMNAALQAGPWDIMISDHSMPRFSPMMALKLLQERGIDLPLIIVSGMIEPDAAVAAMKAGASDFIMKDDQTRLIPAIERELREAQNRRARRAAEEQFRQAQKMESVGRLAGGVAHDFNNLLTAILGYCFFLQGTFEKSDPRLADLEEIIKTSNRAAGLTQQLLAFSRRQILEARVLDLNDSVANIEKMLRRLIGEDVALKTEPGAGLWLVKVDPGQMEQVLLNLAVNARDAMPGGGELTIKTANVEVDAASASPSLKPGAYVMLSVSDTGVGMDESVQARVFEPFFTTKEPGKGTGLGLSTVYGIVQQSGGSISLQSAPGKGTTFRVHFPRVEAPARTGAPAAAAETPVAGSETILLVEDEASVRAIAARTLRGHGYRVLEAQDSETAFRALDGFAGTLHLILTDVVLPGMDGVRLAARLRERFPATSVLYMSGYTDNEIARHELLKSEGSFVRKPFTPAGLARRVRDALDAKA